MIENSEFRSQIERGEYLDPQTLAAQTLVLIGDYEPQNFSTHRPFLESLVSGEIDVKKLEQPLQKLSQASFQERSDFWQNSPLADAPFNQKREVWKQAVDSFLDANEQGLEFLETKVKIRGKAEGLYHTYFRTGQSNIALFISDIVGSIDNLDEFNHHKDFLNQLSNIFGHESLPSAIELAINGLENLQGAKATGKLDDFFQEVQKTMVHNAPGLSVLHEIEGKGQKAQPQSESKKAKSESTQEPADTPPPAPVVNASQATEPPPATRPTYPTPSAADRSNTQSGPEITSSAESPDKLNQGFTNLKTLYDHLSNSQKESLVNSATEILNQNMTEKQFKILTGTEGKINFVDLVDSILSQVSNHPEIFSRDKCTDFLTQILGEYHTKGDLISLGKLVGSMYIQVSNTIENSEPKPPVLPAPISEPEDISSQTTTPTATISPDKLNHPTGLSENDTESPVSSEIQKTPTSKLSEELRDYVEQLEKNGKPGNIEFEVGSLEELEDFFNTLEGVEEFEIHLEPNNNGQNPTIIFYYNSPQTGNSLKISSNLHELNDKINLVFKDQINKKIKEEINSNYEFDGLTLEIENNKPILVFQISPKEIPPTAQELNQTPSTETTIDISNSQNLIHHMHQINIPLAEGLYQTYNFRFTQPESLSNLIKDLNNRIKFVTVSEPQEEGEGIYRFTVNASGKGFSAPGLVFEFSPDRELRLLNPDQIKHQGLLGSNTYDLEMIGLLNNLNPSLKEALNDQLENAKYQVEGLVIKDGKIAVKIIEAQEKTSTP